MEQFIFKDENVYRESGKRLISIDGDENFHMSRVLRVRTGEEVLVTNGTGKTYRCRVISTAKDRSVCEVSEEYDGLNAPRRPFCIAMALLKPMSKIEMALEKCTELGASEFLLFSSERTESPRPRPDRLEGIVRSAVKQSLRSVIPGIKILERLADAAASGNSFERKFVLHEKSDQPAIDRILKIPAGVSVAALIGPEGGFSDKEVEFLVQNRYDSVSLGGARLRSETAAIATAALLNSA